MVECGLMSFSGNKLLFALDAPAVSLLAVIAVYGTVTGDNDSHRVLGACLRHCPGGCWLANGYGNLLIAPGCPTRDFLECLPDP